MADPDGVGDVRVSGCIVGQASCEPMARDLGLERPEPQSDADDDADRRRSPRGRFAEPPGRKPRGLLKTSVKPKGKWDFRRVCALVALSRKGELLVAAFRTAVEEEVRRLYAGQKPGLYAWACAQTAVRHEMRAIMAAEVLTEKFEELSILEKSLLIKAHCDASESRDKSLKLIGLDRLCQGQEEFDPWTAPIEGEANAAAVAGREVDGPDGCVLPEAGGEAAEG